jgi:hypothetical protein
MQDYIRSYIELNVTRPFWTLAGSRMTTERAKYANLTSLAMKSLTSETHSGQTLGAKLPRSLAR